MLFGSNNASANECKASDATGKTKSRGVLLGEKCVRRVRYQGRGESKHKSFCVSTQGAETHTHTQIYARAYKHKETGLLCRRHSPERRCHCASNTTTIRKINQRDVIEGVEGFVCLCGGVGWGVGVQLPVLRSVSPHKSRPSCGSESHRRYDTDAHLLHPLLIKARVVI